MSDAFLHTAHTPDSPPRPDDWPVSPATAAAATAHAHRTGGWTISVRADATAAEIARWAEADAAEARG